MLFKMLNKSLVKEALERLFCESENIIENNYQNTDSEPEVSSFDDALKTIDSVMHITFSHECKVSTLEKEFKVIEVNREKENFIQKN